MRKPLILCVVLILALVGGAWLAPGLAAGPQKQKSQPSAKKPKTPVVLLNKDTQMPRLIRDIEEYVPGAESGQLRLSQSNAAKTALDYLKKNEARLGIQTAGLKLRRARKAGKFWVATFVQHYQNIPVYRSKVGVVVLENGKVVSVGSNFDKTIALDIKPVVTFDQAVAAAAASLKLKQPGALRTERKELMIYPRSKKDKERYSLAWRFLLETKKPNAYAFKSFFVDARTGRILLSSDALVADSLKAQVKGSIWPNDPTNAAEDKPLSFLKVQVGDKKQNTGAQGRFSLDGLSAGTHDLTLALEGPKVKVYKNSGTKFDDFIDNEAKLQASLRTGREETLTFPASDEVNVFYHVNRINDWFKDTFDYDWELDWERDQFKKTQISATCDSGPGVNGLGGNGTVQFGSESGRDWARGADIIYHEFTHNVLQEIFNDYIGFYDGMWTEGYAMDEGFADYFACALTEDSTMGENVTANPRSLQNNSAYPLGAYNIEGHAGGMIISGACWELRSLIDKAEADQLVFQALNIMAAWPSPYYFANRDESNFLDALLIAVGDDRYKVQINAAFVHHNILNEWQPTAPAPSGPAPKVASVTPAHNQRAYGPAQVVITFDLDVNTRTFAGNVVVEREDYKGRRVVECDIVTDPANNKTVTIKPKKSSEGFAPLGTQTNFFVRLVSGTSKGVRGTDGQLLDGDGDGQPGGDYNAKFWVID